MGPVQEADTVASPAGFSSHQAGVEADTEQLVRTGTAMCSAGPALRLVAPHTAMSYWFDYLVALVEEAAATMGRMGMEMVATEREQAVEDLVVPSSCGLRAFMFMVFCLLSAARVESTTTKKIITTGGAVVTAGLDLHRTSKLKDAMTAISKNECS